MAIITRGWRRTKMLVFSGPRIWVKFCPLLKPWEICYYKTRSLLLYNKTGTHFFHISPHPKPQQSFQVTTTWSMQSSFLMTVRATQFLRNFLNYFISYSRVYFLVGNRVQYILFLWQLFHFLTMGLILLGTRRCVDSDKTFSYPLQFFLSRDLPPTCDASCVYCKTQPFISPLAG